MEPGGAQPVRFHHAWIDRVHTDFSRAELLRKRHRYGVNCGFACAVSGRLRCGHRTDDGTNIDDGSAARPHEFDCFFGRQEQTGNVQIEMLFDVLRSNGFQWGELVGAGIVHKDIDLSKCLLNLRKEPVNVLRFRYVTLNRDGPPALPHDPRDHGLGVGLATGKVHYHRSALCRQMLRDGSPDTLRSPGDHCDLSIEFVHRRSPIMFVYFHLFSSR